MTQLLLNLFFSLVVMIYLHHKYLTFFVRLKLGTPYLKCYAILISIYQCQFIKKCCCGSTCYHGAGHVGEINVCIFYTQFSAHINRERGQKKKVLRTQVICYHFQVLCISINTFSSASPTLKVPGYNLMILALKKHRHRSATVSYCGSD